VLHFVRSVTEIVLKGLFHGRVDLDSCPPKPPTDPDMRNWRIRLLKLRIRSDESI